LQITFTKIINYIFFALFGITICSQMGEFGDSIRPIMYAAWGIIIPLGVWFSRYGSSFSKLTIHYGVAYCLYFLYCALLSKFNGDYFDGNYIHIMIIPLMVCCVSDLFRKKIKGEKLQRLLKAYVVVSVIFALWANLQFFSSYAAWLQQQTYVYSSKNSAAQIWGSAILIATLSLDYKNKTEKYFWYVLSIYLFIMLMISQCRTAMLGLFLVVVYIVSSNKENLKKLLVLGFVLSLGVLFHPGVQNFLSQALLLNKYDITDVNSFSSGRIVLYKWALASICNNPLFGVGKWYVDCSYLSILAESGIIGFIIIESIWVHRAIVNFNSGNILLICMTIFYFVESCLEGQPPFGPGVSSFMFWMVSEFLTVNLTGNKNNEQFS